MIILNHAQSYQFEPFQSRIYIKLKMKRKPCTKTHPLHDVHLWGKIQTSRMTMERTVLPSEERQLINEIKSEKLNRRMTTIHFPHKILHLTHPLVLLINIQRVTIA